MPEPWTRLWLPESHWNTHPGIDDDFLTETGARGGGSHLFEDPLPGIGRLSDFADIPFLFLLGRPGSGKTFEMEQAERRGWLGSNCCWIQGKEFGADVGGSLDRLVSASPHATRLCIDGLDEALLEHPEFIAKLRGWLRTRRGPDGAPLHRLALTCRWADWPVSSVEELAALWPQKPATLMLCPLRQPDVVQTLKARLGDKSDEFWRQMNDHHLRPVACWPQGLLGLIGQFKRSKPSRIIGGYSQAVEDQVAAHLSLADSPEECGRWNASATRSDWRRRVAGRVAAAMIWSGSSRLDVREAVSGGALGRRDFQGEDEPWENAQKAILREDLDALVKRTRLLRRLSDEVHWVFQSQVHQEFLAAEWIHSRNLDASRLRQLFGQEQNGEWRVQPALGAVAAWLAGLDQSFRQLLLEADPLVLLRMDGSRLPAADREAVVDALLKATQRLRVCDPAIRQAHLASLLHPVLHAQLEAWLRRSDVCDAAKELAIEIAEKTDCRSLAAVLWELYPHFSRRVQVDAASSLFRLATADEHNDRWDAVLRGDIPADKEGALAGAALQIRVLKGNRPLREVLQWVVPPPSFGVFGLFDMTVRSLPEKLVVEDLPRVFASLGADPGVTTDTVGTPQALHRAAIRLAIAHVDDDAVRDALCAYWFRCLAHHIHPHHDHNESWTAQELGLRDDEHRRSVSRALIEHAGFSINADRKWLMASDYLLDTPDVDWICDRLVLSPPDMRWRWALALASLMWRAEMSPRVSTNLQQVWESTPDIHVYFPVPAPGEGVSAAVRRLIREQDTAQKGRQNGWERKRRRADLKFKRDLARYSDECKQAHERGELAWGGAVRILFARANGRGPSSITFEPISGIGQGDEWMIDAAARHLTQLPSKRIVTLDDGLTGLLALAACLGRIDTDTCLRDAVGTHWLAPFLADLSRSYLGVAPEGLNLKRFAAWFPEEMPSALETVIADRYRASGELGEISAFQPCWSPDASARLARLLRLNPIDPAGFFNAVRHLERNDRSLAADVIRLKMASLGEGSSVEMKAAVFSCALFLANGSLVGEATAIDALKDKQTARTAIWKGAHFMRYPDRNFDFSGWRDAAIRSVAELCWHAYPKLDRHRSRDFTFHEVTGEDEAMEFRDRITSEATRRGLTPTLPLALDEDTPEDARDRLRWIDWQRNESAKARLKASRTLIEPLVLARFCSTSNARLARNSDDLMEAVMLSIRRWERDLTNGNWKRIWDLKPLRPRSEEDIAAELRDWLKADLGTALVEREIELKSERRTDILIQTVNGNEEKLTVLIELKKVRRGNTNERHSAMQTQLRDIYLKERLAEGWTHGLYVVAWTAPGSSCGDAPEIQIEASFLEAQAASLSQPPFKLKSMVIDARSRGPEGRKRPKSAPRGRKGSGGNSQLGGR